MQYKITKLGRKEVHTKFGPKQRVGFQVEGNPNWISVFENDVTKVWKVGDTVEGEIEKNGEYHNFVMAKKPNDADTLKVLIEIRETLRAMLAKMGGEIQTENEIPF